MIRSSERAGLTRLRVTLDATYAGINTTGVGLYSARLVSELRKQASEHALDIRCFGSACKPERAANKLVGTFEEWPTYTHGILPARLLAYRPQVVHATSHMGPLWGPGKLIVTVHDLIFMRYPDDYQAGWLAITRALLPAVLRRARAIIADSYATKDDLHDFFGVPEGKIVVIYPGIDATTGSRPRANDDNAPLNPARPGRSPYILCLGPWVRRKNLEVVFDAFGLLAGELPRVGLVVTGDTPRGMKGYSRHELLSRIPADYRHRAHLVGYVSDLEKRALIAGAGVLCYPSRFEGFGLPPLEAMAAGVPVVAANTPAVVEVTGGATLTANPDDPGEWASTIRRVISDPDLAGRLTQEGLRLSAAFTWARCARQTARLYRHVAGAGGPPGKRTADS